MDDRKPSDNAERIVVRLPDGMRDHLGALARMNSRSVNSETVKALEAWLAAGSEQDPTFVRLPDELRDRIGVAAKLKGHTPLEEIVLRLWETFRPMVPELLDGTNVDIRAEIHDAVQSSIERMLQDPEKLKRIGYVRTDRDIEDDLFKG